MHQKHNFSEKYLNKVLSKAKKRSSTINKYRKPKKNIAEQKKDWKWYKGIFINANNIANGKLFIKHYKKELKRAQKKYGVPAEYIASIIGIETKYGKYLGKELVLNSLSSLAFHDRKRSKFFTNELRNFFLMTRDKKSKVHKIKGSYAGAMGYGQFMPSSYMKYAVDFNKDGKKDLWDKVDSIGSIANYLNKKGWKKNSYVIKSSTENGRRGHNFKIIKTYNNSNRYAKVVHLLAQRIKQALKK